MQHVGKPDLARLLCAVAAVRPEATLPDPLTLAQRLSGGRPLTVMFPDRLTPDALDPDAESGVTASHDPIRAARLAAIPGVSIADDPDEADIALVIHLPGDAAADTAATVQAVIETGHRIAVVDLSREDERGDPDLPIALASTTLYLSNLAAYDMQIERAIAAILTPIRDGAAHRLMMAHTLLYYWAWRGIVEQEVRKTFGDTIPERWTLRAETQAKSRLGATMLKLRGRGLRYFIHAVGYEGGRIDGFWADLRAG